MKSIQNWIFGLTLCLSLTFFFNTSDAVKPDDSLSEEEVGWSEWSSWTHCIPGKTKQRHRKRSCDQGAYCPGPSTQTEACPICNHIMKMILRPSEALFDNRESMTYTCHYSGGADLDIEMSILSNGNTRVSHSEDKYPIKCGSKLKWSVNLKPGDDHVKCVVKDKEGFEVGQMMSKIKHGDLPTLTVTPDSQSVLEGASVSFMCRVQGQPEPSPSVQWMREDGTELSSFNGKLSLQNVTLYNDGRYICQGENDVGQSKSSVKLRVLPLPKITIFPSTPYVEVYEGQQVNLECVVTDVKYPKVIFYKVGSTRGHGGSGSYSKTTGSISLQIDNVSEDDEGIYKCLASNEIGGGMAENYTELKVINKDKIINDLSLEYDPDKEFPPEIVFDREYETAVRSGENIEIICSASGNQPMNITWSRLDRNELSERVSVNDGLLQITNIEDTDRGTYVCAAENIFGTSKKITEIDVQDPMPPQITINSPQKVKVIHGDNVNITCSVSGDEPLTVSWSREDRNDEISERFSSDKGSLQIFNIEKSDQGKYVCNSKNRVGEDSSAIEIIVLDAPIAPPKLRLNHSKNISVELGSNIEIKCSAIGDMPIDITWRRQDGYPLSTSAQSIDGVLTISKAQLSDNGVYICDGTNRGGADKTLIEITVKSNESMPAKVTLSTGESIKVLPKDNVEINCTASGDQPLQIVWRRKNKYPFPLHIKQNKGLLTISNISVLDQGHYSCRGSNYAGTDEKDVEIIVSNPPEVYLNSTKVLKVKPGDDVNISCSATGIKPMVFKWRHLNGHLSKRATVYGHVLRISEIRTEDSGKYACHVENVGGESQAHVSIIVMD